MLKSYFDWFMYKERQSIPRERNFLIFFYCPQKFVVSQGAVFILLSQCIQRDCYHKSYSSLCSYYTVCFISRDYIYPCHTTDLTKMELTRVILSNLTIFRQQGVWNRLLHPFWNDLNYFIWSYFCISDQKVIRTDRTIFSSF